MASGPWSGRIAVTGRKVAGSAGKCHGGVAQRNGALVERVECIQQVRDPGRVEGFGTPLIGSPLVGAKPGGQNESIEVGVGAIVEGRRTCPVDQPATFVAAEELAGVRRDRKLQASPHCGTRCLPRCGAQLRHERVIDRNRHRECSGDRLRFQGG